ncbi:hypothetical protein EZS27_023315 [termite gut metagenome]|uniref:Uncharacterized protein n=1 Tax=termite gut metagenome TaxID=433724 RepID=A0A5J4R2F7_9ZZZZ
MESEGFFMGGFYLTVGNSLINFKPLIKEYESEIVKNPNKYSNLLDMYLPIQIRELFQEKKEIYAHTNKIIFKDFWVYANFIKHNYEDICIYFIGNKFLKEDLFIELIANNNDFRDFIKLNIHIKKIYQDITIKDAL